MSLIVIYNPVCGHGTAKSLFEEKVIPLIKEQGKQIHGVFETAHAGHSGEIVLDHLRSFSQDLTIVLGSGDGTLHEIINAVKSFSSSEPREITFALVPCGTANALYYSLFPPTSQEDVNDSAYALRSLTSFLSSNKSIPLTFALTSVSSADGEGVSTETSISVVVASTSLHASILHDSEALRETIPGIDRFKIAAQQNITRWYSARAKLLPKPGFSSVELYDPNEDRFIQLEHPVVLEGPFAYFLSTVNVDRLESAFRITPFHRASGTVTQSLEVVILRPLRHPNINDPSDQSKTQFAATSGFVLGGAYRDGAHVRMRYNEDGSITEDGHGESVIEYYRCGGWEWSPVSVSLCLHSDF